MSEIAISDGSNGSRMASDSVSDYPEKPREPAICGGLFRFSETREPQAALQWIARAVEHRLTGRWRPWLIGVLLLIHSTLVFHCAVEDFVTFDEIGNLTAGLSYWDTACYRLYNVNPPLPKLLATLPVFLANPDMSAVCLPQYPGQRPEWAVGERFARDNASRYQHFVVLARSVGLLWSLLGALGVYCWAKALWGHCGGLFALAVWCFEPNIIAHAHLLNVDVPAAVAALWGAYFFRDYLVSPCWSTALLAGLVLGLAELCKFTLLLLYPVYCVLWLLFIVRGQYATEKLPSLSERLGQLLLIFALSLLVINTGYEFSGTGKQLKEIPFVSESLSGVADDEDFGDSTADNRFKGTWRGEIILPLPEDMVRGMDVQRRGFERNRHKYSKYLRGEWSQTGWWYYYLYAAAVKVPLGLWGLLLFALAGRFWNRASGTVSWSELLALWLFPLVLFVFVSAHPRMQTHLRYVLPVFPFVIVYLGRAGLALAGGRLGRGLVAGGLLLWTIGSYLSVHPHSLAYFNELAGGPEEGHYHLSGSNIDWGQDLLRLKRWLDAHPEAKPLGLAYFNYMDPRIIGIEFRLPPMGFTGTASIDRQSELFGPVPGYFAVSRRFSDGGSVLAPDGAGGYVSAPLRSLQYFQHFQPIAKAGYSILIYHITLEEANRVRRQYGLPLLPPNWGRSSSIEGKGPA